MNSNPFSLVFGKEPTQMISRIVQTEEIVNCFNAENPPQQAYIITGIRGVGKTVLMTNIANRFRKQNDWVVIELNSSSELLKDLAAKLYNEKGLSSLFQAAGIDLSFFGIGINIKKVEPITDLETAIVRMLKKLKEKNKRLLITIDEVSNSKEMRVFAGAFQIFVRQELPIFLLMTGLYENINSLQNEKNLTFLYRAPKQYLKSLNLTSVARDYKNIFNLGDSESHEMAKLTAGYPFAFQVLGYHTFEHKGDYKAAIDDARQYLDEYAYDKIWMELSETEKRIVALVAKEKVSSVKDIKERLNLPANAFSVFRDRLIKKGIVNGDRRGYLQLTLPFFDEYIDIHTEEY